jgi:diguanylate cyclase (GGDEF)-like protein
MLWYVALIAILNLGLGFGLAVHLRACADRRRQLQRARLTEMLSRSDQSGEAETFEMSPAVFVEGMRRATAAAATSPTSPAAADIDPTTGLTTRNFVAERLTDMTLAHADLQPMTVAMLEVDSSDASLEDDLEDRLLRGVAGTIRGCLTDAHTAGRYSDQQFLLLLPFDDLEHATRRAEQVRQRISATRYVADGKEIPASVTCALSQVSASQSAEELLDHLAEVLEEAKRAGGNQTFAHDGIAAAAVESSEMDLAEETCAI